MSRRTGVYGGGRTGGGGGPAPSTGTVVIGPDYGESSGNDGRTYTASARTRIDRQRFRARVLANAATRVDRHRFRARLQAMALTRIDRQRIRARYAASASVRSYVRATLQPDADLYLDRANAAANFGSTTGLLAKFNTAVINDDKNAYVLWDLTNYGSGQAQDGVFVFNVSHGDLVLSHALSYEWYTHTSMPFVEGSATWNADEPPPGTVRQATTVSIPAGTGRHETTVIVPAAVISSALSDGYVYFRALGQAGLAGDVTTFTVDSRESSGFEPLLTLNLRLL